MQRFAVAHLAGSNGCKKKRRWLKRGRAGCGKSELFCHSERSEESLCGLDAGKERFLGAQRASE
jgi:hypothetical protein